MKLRIKKYNFIAVFFALGIFVFLVSSRILADEHPSEHPTKKIKMDEKKDETKSEEKKPALDEFRKAAEENIKKTMGENKGFYPVHDEKENLHRKLKFKKIHEKKLTQLEGNVYFACMDFQEAATKNKVDLDFWMEFKDGGWELQKVLIHKVNGKPRFVYKNNKPVPVK